jgi:hypothetical protein
MSEPAKRSGWHWLWIIGGVLFLTLVLGCCLAPVINLIHMMLTSP